MVRKIVTDINILKTKSINVGFLNSRGLIKDLEDTLKITKHGIGLSAIQIGVAKKVSIIRLFDFKLNLINAEIIEKQSIIRVKNEGCLSLPGLYIDTKRYNYIKLNNRKKYSGLIAIAIQHELDHQKGLTILDRKWKHR